MVNDYRNVIDRYTRQLMQTDEGLKSIHIAIMVEPFLSYVLNGKKTIESRINKTKSAPYGKVSRGDIVFLKRSGGFIVGMFRASDVCYISIESEKVLEMIKENTVNLYV